MENDFAIIIGINDYTLPEKRGLKTLRGAINDVNKFEEWLISKDGGWLSEGNIKKIISNPNPLNPLQDEIDDAFLEIEDTIKEEFNYRARRLYFYFAGHGIGTLDDTSNTALCLANWSEKRRHSALSSSAYKEKIKQYGYFEEIIFIADCCRNTKINIIPKAPTFSCLAPTDLAGQTKMFVAYATQYQDQSYEVQHDNSEMRGAFTTVFLEGLKGSAGNNGIVGVDDLRDFLIKETPIYAQKMGYKQIPEIIHNFPGNEILIELNPSSSKTNVNFIFSDARSGIIELRNGNLSFIENFDALNIVNASAELNVGLYKLIDLNSNEEKFFQVSLRNTNIDVRF